MNAAIETAPSGQKRETQELGLSVEVGAYAAASGTGAKPVVVPLGVVAAQQREIEELRQSLVQMQAMAEVAPTPPNPPPSPTPAAAPVVSPLLQDQGTVTVTATIDTRWVFLYLPLCGYSHLVISLESG